MKWSWSAFFAKLTSRQFWVWIVVTFITWGVLKVDGDHEWIKWVIIVWGATSLIYLMGHIIVDAIAKAVGNAEIKLGGS